MTQDDAPDTIIQPPQEPDADVTQVAPPDAEKTAVVSPEPGATQVVAPTICPVCNATNPAGEIYCVDCGFLLSSVPGEGTEPVSVEELIRLVSVTDETRVSPLHSGTNSVGREDADVLLTDATVSRKHATIFVDGEKVTVTDIGSTNGTTVNSIRLAPNESRVLKPNDEIAFGRIAMRLLVPGVEPGPPAVSEEPESIPEGAFAKLTLSGIVTAVHYVAADEFRIGRREGDLILPDSYCSGRHAVIARGDDGVTITDLGSTNGTLVNGEKIAVNEPVALGDGDEIAIGQTKIAFALVAAAPPPETQAAAPAASDTAEDATAREQDTQPAAPAASDTAEDATARERLPESAEEGLQEQETEGESADG
jgi:pSer/pThr/pTyr-binding forkhead associated (FHA) protein